MAKAKMNSPMSGWKAPSLKGVGGVMNHNPTPGPLGRARDVGGTAQDEVFSDGMMGVSPTNKIKGEMSITGIGKKVG